MLVSSRAQTGLLCGYAIRGDTDTGPYSVYYPLGRPDWVRSGSATHTVLGASVGSMVMLMVMLMVHHQHGALAEGLHRRIRRAAAWLMMTDRAWPNAHTGRFLAVLMPTGGAIQGTLLG